MFPASFIFTPAHLHTREFSGYRIPSLAPVPHISLSSHHQPSLFCQFPSLSSSAVSSALWGGCTQADGGMSLTPLTAHYSFSCFLTLFPHTHKCVLLYPLLARIASLTSDSTRVPFIAHVCGDLSLHWS